MSELKTDNIKKSVWLAQNKACEILGIKLRTLKEYCYRSKFIYKIKKVKAKCPCCGYSVWTSFNKIRYQVCCDDLLRRKTETV